METQTLIISVLFMVSVTGLVWQVALAARRATYVTLADGRRQERSLPLIIRLMLPFTSSFPQKISMHRKLEESRARISRKLVAAGFEGLIEAHEVIALRALVPLGFGGFICAMIALTIPLMSGQMGPILADRQFLFYFIFILLFGIYTDVWLKSAVKARHQKIERALPFVLDLLTLAVESGLDFMSGINRIIQKREIDPLGEELIRVFREIQVGRSRREALRNLAVRVDHPDIRAVSNALIQADELGSGIGGAMRIQADQIRVKRFQRAEKRGNEAPVKMLFPLIAFIFPSVFLILLGPILLRLLDGAM